MFGRRRRRVLMNDVPASAVPQQSGASKPDATRAEMLDTVRAQLDACFGADGSWTLVRRSADDTDAFFHEMASASLARQIVDAIAGPSPSNEEHVDPAVSVRQPAALAPVTDEVAPLTDALAVWAEPESAAKTVDPSFAPRH